MGRPLNPEHDHRVSLKEAAELTRRYRQGGGHRPSDSGAFNAAPVRELLAQPGCMGVRVYRGRHAGGDSALVLVGVDADGNDMTGGLVLDKHLPCPPFCSDENALSG